MQLDSLYIRDFRPFEEKQIHFSPGLNVILGPNAMGKTTLLEAIYLLVAGRSFRTSRLGDLVRKGSASFYVEGHYQKHEIQRQIRVSWGGEDKRIWSDQTPCSGLSALPGLLPGVVMTPGDIELIKGSPQERRDYLDSQMAQVDPLYMHHHLRYQRAMRQRNVLLKSRQTLTMDAWEYEMAYSAAYLTQKRKETIDDLRLLCKSCFEYLGAKQEQLDMQFKIPSEPLHEYYLESFRKNRIREMDLGVTLTGPHKDDFTLLINGQEARFFASEGQQRTCVAALRMAEWQRLKELCGETPLMLIDDIGTSLDRERQQKLWKHLSELGQVIVTTNHAEEGHLIKL